MAPRLTTPPQDDRNIVKRWSDLAEQHGLDLVVCVAAMLLFFLIYTGSGLVAGGKLFEAVFGLPYLGAVAVGTLAILVYTAWGAFSPYPGQTSSKGS